jgi:hypothetical protein
MFSNGRGGENPDLRQLDVRNGDTVTMSWRDVDESCKTPAGAPAITVSLAVYAAAAATFDRSVSSGGASAGAAPPELTSSSASPSRPSPASDSPTRTTRRPRTAAGPRSPDRRAIRVG